jgi:hypothetical protein
MRKHRAASTRRPQGTSAQRARASGEAATVWLYRPHPTPFSLANSEDFIYFKVLLAGARLLHNGAIRL